MDEPFAFVAAKDGRWYGVIVGDRKDEVKKFYRRWAGYTITPIASREDWLAYAKTTPAFSPDEQP